MRVLTVIGNRPQFIKAAAVSPHLRIAHEEVLVHTGQHFDDRLSAVFFAELGLPAPDRQLGVALGSASSQTARMLTALEPVLTEVAPDCVLVYGDTNSTLAGALAGAQAGVPVAHVEAGMRSFDRTMPEELNRVLCDHAASLLLCPTQTAVENLRREGVAGEVRMVGDVMVDVSLAVLPRVRERDDLIAARGLERGCYALATAHRAGNVDEPSRLASLVELLSGVARDLPLLMPVHPRTERRLRDAGLWDVLARSPGVTLAEPVGYFELAALMCGARVVLTDSGGLQKEAYLAGVPCVTLRDSTEWVETVNLGWNTLVGLDPRAARAALERPAPDPGEPRLAFGDGQAGGRVVEELTAWWRRTGR
ncbi:MAG TPA: UDP-N-acetylglucosamine 2-epimerase (non-hydrolyzing) [Solirubrobacteraceae bacterium]|nr:UDP-N-acetylglucosamine 2-epimerase (non-hydrolyzing) [Solirubrobacteraceae bacterium]